MMNINKQENNAFINETTRMTLTETVAPVKEAIIIEDVSKYSPTIFLYLFDKRFFHISLRKKILLDRGKLEGQLASQFKAFTLDGHLYVSYMQQYEMRFLDLVNKGLRTEVFNITVPTHAQFAVEEDDARMHNQENAFCYECFPKSKLIVTCEVFDKRDLSDKKHFANAEMHESLLVVCSFFKQGQAKPFSYTYFGQSEQMNVCKLDDDQTVGFYHKHHVPIKDKIDFIIQTQEVDNLTPSGHRMISVLLSDQTCIIFTRLLGDDRKKRNKLIVAGNDKEAPFIRIFSLVEEENRNLHNGMAIVDLMLYSFNQSLISNVYFGDDKHILVERVNQTGTFLQFMSYYKSDRIFEKKVQHLKNPHQRGDFWMDEEELSEMNYFYKDKMYVQNIFAASPKTLSFIDDSDSVSPERQASGCYDIQFYTQRFTTRKTLIVFAMDSKGLRKQYSDIVLQKCCAMLTEES